MFLRAKKIIQALIKTTFCRTLTVFHFQCMSIKKQGSTCINMPFKARNLAALEIMSMLKKIKLVIFYLISFAIVAQQKDNVHAVEDLNQSKPVTKYPCCSNTTKISCNLSDAMKKLRELQNNTVVIITNQYNYLWDHQNFTIHNKSNMTLMGYSNKTDEIPIICCKNSSLTFLSISHLYIKNLVFVGCGCGRNTCIHCNYLCFLLTLIKSSCFCN